MREGRGGAEGIRACGGGGAWREFFCFPETGCRCSTDRTVHGVLRSGVVGLIVLLVNVLSFSERTGRQFGRHLSAVGWSRTASEWMRTDRIGCGGSEWLGGRGTNDFLSGRGCFRRIAICSVVSSRGMGTIQKVCCQGILRREYERSVGACSVVSLQWHGGDSKGLSQEVLRRGINAFGRDMLRWALRSRRRR